MNNNLNYNIVFNTLNDNRVISAIKQINTNITNIENATIRVDKAFIKMTQNITQHIKKHWAKELYSANTYGIGF